MPRPLLARLKPDSIAEFRAAASERFRDGVVAAANDRRTAAIYLWGYCAEMTVKAAYFSLASFGMTQSITIQDLGAARTIAMTQHQIIWPNPGKFHNVAAWAELLIKVRASSSLTCYPNPEFEALIQTQCDAIQRLWSEQLRYHKNVAYPHEVETMSRAAEWLLIHSTSL